ncbi:hypothetical protein GGS23DRAFT_580874 [Durotheca rogersii]|uniref:uncharacterized protein n=1 Tax=Durotheca rogersii TaxID=419775 RepID=UPI00222126C2|nr:uncharacterized protein GGS23DRAFT_580874 [Durotheca rogersii]KAI5860324.1 hypothetical protein GGS23DRAFT_580874 [Durotheca rogersii]
MVRTISNRLLPLAVRYISVLFTAVLVYYVIREPVSIAIRGIPFPQKSESSTSSDQDGRIDAGESAKLGGPLVNSATVVLDLHNEDTQGPRREPDEKVKYVKKYKPDSPPPSPIEDHFPLLTHSTILPSVLENNLPPNPHVEEATPLLIGFTRNWPLLLQCVSSYIAAGWPPQDIYVVENTGVFRANRRGELGLQNPFFLNHTALGILGINVITAPTLLSFSQLQNFYLHTALERDWPFFFWSHQDVLVLSDEDVKKNDRDHDWDHDPYATIYERCVGLLRYLNGPDMAPWATHFFAFDHLTLVNRDAYLEVGAWDTHIPYYASDCDMYLRLHWAGYWQPQSKAGLVFDVNTVLDDIASLFRVPGARATFQEDPIYAGNHHSGDDDNIGLESPHHEAELKREEEMWSWVDKEGETFAHLVEVATRMQEFKLADEGVRRNTWHGRQAGGMDDPFYRDADGFARGLEMLIDVGRRVFADKWGHRGCDLLKLGIEGRDAWRLERDWDIEIEGPGSVGGSWGEDWMMDNDGRSTIN